MSPERIVPPPGRAALAGAVTQKKREKNVVGESAGVPPASRPHSPNKTLVSSAIRCSDSPRVNTV